MCLLASYQGRRILSVSSHSSPRRWRRQRPPHARHNTPSRAHPRAGAYTHAPDRSLLFLSPSLVSSSSRLLSSLFSPVPSWRRPLPAHVLVRHAVSAGTGATDEIPR